MTDNSNPFWHGLAAGGCAAVVSRIFTYPPDTVKARLQVQDGHKSSLQHYAGTVDAFVQIAKGEGIRGFYRGFGALLLTVIPANMCYFSGYELGKQLSPKSWGVGSDVVTAVIAQTFAGIAYCPIDIVKQTVQTAGVVYGSTDSSCRNVSPLQATRDIWRAQGLRGFYRGYWAMNTLWMPWNLLYLTTYEACKRKIYDWKIQEKGEFFVNEFQGGDSETIFIAPTQAEILPAWAYPACSSSCAAMAAVVTHPIDVVKTRLQVLSARTGKAHHAYTVAADLWRHHGISGFGKGLGARVATMSMGTSISWFVYEMVKGHLRFK